MVDPDRLSAAYETARCDLLAESAAAGHWIGQLSSSALATATAISALAIVERSTRSTGGCQDDSERECAVSELIMSGVRWLARHQNPDGGWGDTERSVSNIATTMTVRYAFALSAVPADHPGLLERADGYIKANGGLRGLRRHYGNDKTFIAPILTNGALAGMVPWRRVPSLPFELAALPARLWKSWRLPVDAPALPALVAVGQARYYHRKPWNPVARLLRRLSAAKTLERIEPLVPFGGGYCESPPATSFVVMSLASIGQAQHPVARRGVEFLLATVRADGSWPIVTNLATWNTTLAVNALAAGGDDPGELPCLDWLLACQKLKTDPYGTAPGGWSWTDRSGAVPDADNTAGALLALAAWSKADPALADRIHPAAQAGVSWLLGLQNADGGWPTFCRGRGKRSFDTSGCDLTAHALRALNAWRATLGNSTAQLDARIGAAIERGFGYLDATQHAEGFWRPLWFGDQHRASEDNPIYGTAKVLAAYRDLRRLDAAPVRRALDWLAAAANADGSWGIDGETELQSAPVRIHVEQTALAVEALLTAGLTRAHQSAAGEGLKWLVDAVEANRHQECSPIGYGPGKLWYHEKLYPLIFSVAALGQAARLLLPERRPHAVVHASKT